MSKPKNSSIIGVYEGEALDSAITNKNGMDITREVIENTLASEEYADGIEYGWFIGFLGHPEDPGCQEFKNGCIVLTDMSINDRGKVYAKFNLVDTPVGQVVKKFIDAGVRFGISIRGAGDVVGNSVDPDTFMFRGFDLVAFPAYPESIPTFTEIAASTDVASRKKYQAVCAAVKENLPMITNATTLDIIQQQFAPQSAEYASIEAQKKTITSSTDNIDAERVEAMTYAYINCLSENKDLQSKLTASVQRNHDIESSYRRKFKAIERITGAQTKDILASLDASEKKCGIFANRSADMRKEIIDLRNTVKDLQKTNLIYKQRITASDQTISEKQATIRDLNLKLRETVTASTKAKTETSNRDAENRRLTDELIECQEQLTAFQTAYANIYANALGVSSVNIQVSPHTTVEEIQSAIAGSTNSCNMAAQPALENFYPTGTSDDEDEIVYI